MFRRITKWSFLGFFILLAAALSLFQCISFGVKQEDVDAYFQARSVEPVYHQIKVGDRDVHYVTVGDPTKPMVLFVHGSPGDWTAFLNYMAHDALLDKAFLVSIDRPGFGKSGRGDHEESLIRQAEALRPILEQRHNKAGAILVGHSYGGPVIARAAMDMPQMISGLVLVAASIDPELEKTKWIQYPAEWKVFSWLVPVDLRTSNREIMPLKGELETMMPLWAGINQPVTVIHGGKDRLVPIGNADFAQKKLTDAPVKMMRFDELNHFVLWTRPDLITNAVLELLSGAQTTE